MATAEEADWVAPSPITTNTTASTSNAVAVRLFVLSRSARLRAAARTFDRCHVRRHPDLASSVIDRTKAANLSPRSA